MIYPISTWPWRGSRFVIVTVALLTVQCTAWGAGAESVQSRDQAQWVALTKDCAVPAGDSAIWIVQEAVSFLGSTDTFWRDDIGYGIVATCVYDKHVLTPSERQELVATLSANLRRGIGGTGDDLVLLRSFSALDLSVLAAAELKSPGIDDAGYRRLLDDAFEYLKQEKDLRGYEPRVGWIHATAHTADLLKFLARDARFARADHRRLLDASWSKVTAADTPVFIHAEDERLAAALASLLRRPDFDANMLGPWLEQFVALEKQTWAGPARDVALLAASQNARNLLQGLFVQLSYSQPEPTAGQAATREQVLAALQRIRR